MMQRNDDVAELLIELNVFEPLNYKQTKRSFESICDKAKKWLMIASAILFGIVLFLVLIQKFVVELPYTIKWIALLMICAVVLFPTITLLIDIGLGALQLARFKTETFRTLLLEIKHDKYNADAITKYEKKVLKEVKDWLEMKCSRIKARVGIFFGGSEKIALISLAGFGWITFKEVFHGKIPDSLPSASDDPVQFTILTVVAFFTGLSVGAMLLNQQMRRYLYHIEVIEMALKKKPE